MTLALTEQAAVITLLQSRPKPSLIKTDYIISGTKLFVPDAQSLITLSALPNQKRNRTGRRHHCILGRQEGPGTQMYPIKDNCL